MNASGRGSGPLRIAGLISGGGSTIANIVEHIRNGQLAAEVVLTICSNSRAGGIERMRGLGLDVEIVARKQFDSTEAFSDKVFSLVRDAKVDLICLGGFLSLLRIPDDYTHRMMNIHPALLPSFGGQGMYGHYVHEAVLAAGCKVSGCTVHFADNEYDRGPIIVQRTCAVEEDDTPDTLADRVMAEERIAYPEAINLFAADRLRVEDHRVSVLPSA